MGRKSAVEMGEENGCRTAKMRSASGVMFRVVDARPKGALRIRFEVFGSDGWQTPTRVPNRVRERLTAVMG